MIYSQETELFGVLVVLPIYNEKEEIVKKVIHFILSQKNVDLELLIIDDYSDNRESLSKVVYSYYEADSKVDKLILDLEQAHMYL